MATSFDRRDYRTTLPQLEKRLKTLEDSNAIIVKHYRKTKTISASSTGLFYFGGASDEDNNYIVVKGYEPLAVTEVQTSGTNANRIFFFGWDFNADKDSLTVGARNTHSASVTLTIEVGILYVAKDSTARVPITSGGGGASITVDAVMSAESINPVQNRVIYNALENVEVDALTNEEIENLLT